MSILLYFLLNFCLVLAQDNRDPDENNHFIYPPLPGPQYSNDPTVFETNINFTVGKSQNQPFKWVSNMTYMQIILCQEGNPESVQLHDITECIDGTSDDFIYWDGDIGSIDLNNGSQAYLGVWNCSENSTPVFFSHYINLVEDDSVSSTTSSASSTTTSSSASSSSTSLATGAMSVNSAAASPTDTSTPSEAASADTSNAAVIGGGIGGGIGGALLVIAVAFAVWKYRTGKKKNQRQPGGQQIATWANNQSYNPVALTPNGSNMYKPPYGPTELYSHPSSVAEAQTTPGGGTYYEQGRVYEMPSDDRR
ncbi:hypothetical protein M426DRAFT_12263 [Hypoxylon sp. CI-4A]|nr:hypothetical protein M426DRAFT_12263 [Hypoxylon sp. CI-4A]